jgi:hypothetical protein
MITLFRTGTEVLQSSPAPLSRKLFEWFQALVRDYNQRSAQTGTIRLFAFATPLPEGWLACDGSAVSRAKNAELFATVGTSFGPGDGSTTFNVPSIAAPASCAYAVKT